MVQRSCTHSVNARVATRRPLLQVELQRVDGLIAQHAGLKAVLQEEQLQLQASVQRGPCAAPIISIRVG
jgi:hypothetical protein